MSRQPMTAQSEQRIRDESARLGGPDCDCAPCFLLRLLDAARAERDSAEKKIASVEALFSGGPDTPCRTTWRRGIRFWGEDFTIECVEVPMDDLRAALGDQVGGDQRNGRHSTTCAYLVRHFACDCDLADEGDE